MDFSHRMHPLRPPVGNRRNWLLLGMRAKPLLIRKPRTARVFHARCRPAAPDLGSQEPFALGLFARQLAEAADRFRPFARTLFAGFLEMLPKLHLAEDAFTLQFLFQRTERLVYIVVANADLHVAFTAFPS